MTAETVRLLDAGELGPAIEAVRAEQPVPGVAVGILADGRELVTGIGVTNVEHPLPVDGDTLFQIGSITKTVLGTAVMRLVDRGSLALDAPVRTYLPDLRLADEEVAARVTLLHLLTHTAGWFGDYFEDCGPGDDALARYVAKMVELDQLSPPGAIWSYSNSGFCLAGRVVEVVTGKTVEDALRELVLSPLGMSRSFFFATEAITHRVAAGHFIIDDAPVVARPWHIPRTNHAAGGIVSTARDMLRYARFHLGDGTGPDGVHLLSSDAMRHMRSPLAPRALGESSGIAWAIHEVEGVPIIAHGGGTSGQQSLLGIAPERGFALVVLTNSGRGGFVNRVVWRWALRAYLGLEEPEPSVESRSLEELQAYSGHYESPGNAIELTLDGKQLVLRSTSKVSLATEYERRPPPPPPARLAFCGIDRVVVLDGPTKDTQGEFLRDAASAIVWFRIGGRIHARRP